MEDFYEVMTHVIDVTNRDNGQQGIGTIHGMAVK